MFKRTGQWSYQLEQRSRTVFRRTTSGRLKILVIKNRAIGDTILMTGPLRLLRRQFPGYEIHVLVRAPAGQLLEHLPSVDRIISAKEPKNKLDRLAYWTRLIKRLRRDQYEMVLNFHASTRSALTARCLRSTICVVNHHEIKGINWGSQVSVPGRHQVKPNIDRDLDVLRAIGMSCNMAEAMPEVILTPAEKAWGLSALQTPAVALQGQAPVRIFLGIGASRETKRFKAADLAQLVWQLSQQGNCRFVLCALDNDGQWLADFDVALERLVQGQRNSEPIVERFCNRSLREVASLMAHCGMYMGNDSGLKHLAVALGLRTLTWFGPESPVEWASV
jgi:heptosyltransferase-3